MPPPGESRKRKEREAQPAFYSVKPSISSARPHHQLHHSYKPEQSNVLLAGYLAYEFLSKGTILGEKFDPARAEAASVAQPQSESRRSKGEVREGKKKEDDERKYAEVASLLKTEGAHIPEIVNPTQLARWIKM
ncbi:hypothetical protein LINGRAHAP2_LOCUS23298 [Linum grandiflorum]